MNVYDFEKIKDDFVLWLKQQEAIMHAPTSEWEVMRFKANDQMRVIYKNKRGGLSFVHHADVYMHAYLSSKPESKVCRRLLRDMMPPTDQRLWDSGIWG